MSRPENFKDPERYEKIVKGYVKRTTRQDMTPKRQLLRKVAGQMEEERQS